MYNLRAETMKWDTAKEKLKLTNATGGISMDSRKQCVQNHEMHMNLNIKPGDLQNDEYIKDKLTTPYLRNFIKMEELRGSEGLNTLRVELYRRTATPFTVLLLTVIGVVVSSRKMRGGSGLHLAIGIIIAVVFILCDRLSTVFPAKGEIFPPLNCRLASECNFSEVLLTPIVSNGAEMIHDNCWKPVHLILVNFITSIKFFKSNNHGCIEGTGLKSKG